MGIVLLDPRVAHLQDLSLTSTRDTSLRLVVRTLFLALLVLELHLKICLYFLYRSLLFIN
jgi:hypothetical protein